MAQAAAVLENWPLREPFVIARSSRTHIPIITVRVSDGGHTGWGEGQPNARFGEDPERALDEALTWCARELPLSSLEAISGSARSNAVRNAFDAALLDLEAKKRGIRVWDYLTLSEPGPVRTAFTLSLGAPECVAEAARVAWAKGRTLLKVKLGGAEDADILAAVRRAAPDADLVVDANEGWGPDRLQDMLGRAADAGVLMVEQPLPAEEDACLADLQRPVPVCADESLSPGVRPSDLADRYDWINIKLDKTGGLRPAIATARAAKEAGMNYMVGCMICTSLGAAAAMPLTTGAALVDLDGPLLLAKDRATPLEIDGACRVFPSESRLWG